MAVEKHLLDGWVMLVCNPVSGSGQGLARLDRVRRALDAAGVAYSGELTRRRGHAAHLARAAVMSGCRAVVAIGGDGTLHEVVNGVMGPVTPGAQLREDVTVGLI